MLNHFIYINYNQASIFDDLLIIFYFIFVLLLDGTSRRVNEVINPEKLYIFYTTLIISSMILTVNIILTLLDGYQGNTLVSNYDFDSFYNIMK